ncbi:alpha/beta fold hydrolase [Candidatus Rariloculus sp.]|uniref:alpha/beta fold hydrolase n=1 Tax=Candidatus Rariloculus sp. TaxID=3101265 RepID=UPI003D104973
MNRKISHLLAGATLGAVASAGSALAGGEAGELVLRDFGSKFVGYSTEEGDGGSLNVLNAMFVQYLLPADRRHEFPVVMIHGGGGQGTDWLETPDGRDGWVDYFVADGWDVYVVDRPGHGRSQSNAGCGDGTVGVANTAFIARLATSEPSVWPGGAPTPSNDSVVGWAASSATAPYCGNEVAAATISALLDEIGPAILVAHSAGGGSTFRVPDLNSENVVGIIAFEAAGSNPVAPGFGGRPPIADWEVEPPLPQDFEPVDSDGCPMQGDSPSKLVNFADVPVVLVGSELGLNSARETLACQVAVWRQAGVEATSVYFPDRGLAGGGHFAMAQLDNAEYAQVFIELATEMETASAK